MGNKAGKNAGGAAGEEAPMGENAVSPLPEQEAPLAMMEIEKTPISTPAHDMPPPPDEKWVENMILKNGAERIVKFWQYLSDLRF